jgi:hypothetical protein
MKTGVFKIIFFGIFSFALLPAFSQDLTGIWKGYFYTDRGVQYKYELQIGQNKQNSITGVSYSYLDTRFYGKALLKGQYARANGDALVQETRTVEVKMDDLSVTCIMKLVMTYSKSGREEFLEGSYSSVYETTNPNMGATRGADCGGGKVFLRKVTTSDFPLEPFLLKKTTPKPGEKKPTAKPPATAQRQPGRTTSQGKTVARAGTNTRRSTAIPETLRRQIDTIQRQSTAAPVVESRPLEKRFDIPITTRERKNELTKTISVTNEDIEIRLYDNGQIDDDTISVYLDGRLIISKKRLSDKAISYKLKLGESDPEHILVMVAENMGRIPPNTSLMVVQDGDTRYQVSITSTEQKNAMVRFRYQKKD